MRRVLVMLVAGAASLLGVLGAAPAHATSEFVEHINTFDVTLTVAPSGLLTVHEVIEYNFGVAPRHGIFRDIPVREAWTTDSRYERVYHVDVKKVTATGTSAKTKIGTQGNFLDVRIGDPDKTVTGVHTYTLDYTVKGAPTGFPDHDELYWDAVGFQWPVPIDNARIHVNMPADVTRVACYAGSEGSRAGCDSARKSGKTATFTQANLDDEQGVTVAVAIPKGAIAPPPAPILEKKWNLDDAFARRSNTLIPAGGLLVLGLGFVGVLVWRKGRDRRYTGSAVDAAMGNDTGEEQAIPIGAKDAGPVEFIPPDKIRAGEVGMLIDEEANLLDVTATIIDLAVRGYLTITELEPEGLLRRHHDYKLTRIEVDDAKDSELLPYEKKVLLGLFKGDADEVTMSDLKYKFKPQLTKIQESLYQDAMKKGWFRTRPDQTRLVWHAIGLVVFFLGVGLTIWAAAKSTFGLVPLAIVVIGFALIITAHRMPARTGKGSAMLSRVRGFRRLFDEGDEDLRARFAENHHIFSEYLPYAIVFGCTKKWAKVFEGLDADQLGSSSWYGGHANLNAFVLASALDDFGTVATGTMYASQPSSSGGSGFSGGGGGVGGGGGGGSW